MMNENNRTHWRITDPVVFNVLEEYHICCELVHANWYDLSVSIPFDGVYEVAQGIRLISHGTTLFLEGSDTHKQNRVAWEKHLSTLLKKSHRQGSA